MYKNGLRFDDTLAKNLDSEKKRVDMNKASLLIIDGGVGEGKTTLSVECAEYYQGCECNLKNQYALGGEEFMEKLQICYDNNMIVVIYDEAGDFNKRGSLTRFNQQLIRVFQTFRAFKILVILTLPNFNVIDNSLFDMKVPRMLLHCNKRTLSQGNYSGFSLYRMQYIKHKMQKLVIPEYAYTQVVPNFRGHFLDLSTERAKELDKISTAGKLNIVNQNVLESKNLVNIKEISKKIFRDHRWVRKKLRQFKLEPSLIHKKKKYYNSSVIDILMGETR
jgi:hypothetical protein